MELTYQPYELLLKHALRRKNIRNKQELAPIRIAVERETHLMVRQQIVKACRTGADKQQDAPDRAGSNPQQPQLNQPLVRITLLLIIIRCE